MCFCCSGLERYDVVMFLEGVVVSGIVYAFRDKFQIWDTCAAFANFLTFYVRNTMGSREMQK